MKRIVLLLFIVGFLLACSKNPVVWNGVSSTSRVEDKNIQVWIDPAFETFNNDRLGMPAYPWDPTQSSYRVKGNKLLVMAEIIEVDFVKAMVLCKYRGITVMGVLFPQGETTEGCFTTFIFKLTGLLKKGTIFNVNLFTSGGTDSGGD